MHDRNIILKAHTNLFSQIISLDNLLTSWREFRNGKRSKYDVIVFERNLEDNLFQLNHELKTKIYHHSDYIAFYITDPKRRHIHKAEVRDRIVHHAVYRILYPIFGRRFIYDSYSCRLRRGTHKAVERLKLFTRKISANYTKPCFALKCDIKKFFDSVDHNILFQLIKKKINDPDTLSLIWEILSSFERESKGIPLGNLTSQLFANIYLNELDQFIKHKLKIKHYLSYADDFVILGNNRNDLKKLIPVFGQFLQVKLKLQLHPDKIFIRKLKQRIDFCGYVVLPHYTVLRTKTKRRMLKRANPNNLPSYLGLLKHCAGYKLERKIIAHLTQKV